MTRKILTLVLTLTGYSAFACPVGSTVIHGGPFGGVQCGPVFPTLPPPPPPQPQAPVCATVWVGANQDNAGTTIGNLETSLNLNEAKYATRTWHGGLNPHWSGTDRYWVDISSAQVTAGCILAVYSTPDLTGNPLSLPGGANGASYNGPAFPIPGTVNSMTCACDANANTVTAPHGGYEYQIHVPPVVQ